MILLLLFQADLNVIAKFRLHHKKKYHGPHIYCINAGLCCKRAGALQKAGTTNLANMRMQNPFLFVFSINNFNFVSTLNRTT